MSYLSIIVCLSVFFLTFSSSANPTNSDNLDYLDPDTWTHLSQNVLLHDLEAVDEDETLKHHVRHRPFASNKKKITKGPKKGKGQRQHNNNGNNNGSSYNHNNKGKQGLRFLKGISNNFIKTTSYHNQGNVGAWPGIFNVALKAAISANATCGEKGREKYCKIIDARPHKSRVPTEQCHFCDANSEDERHLIENAIDGSPRWWQSPSLKMGRENEYVTITMDLGHIYQILSVMLKAVTSPRPASWILEKSLDGDLYTTWQYFGISDDDCLHRYGLPGVLPSKHWFRTDDEIICSTEFSKPTPLENSEVQISLVNGRPGHNTTSLDLLDFTLARYIRFRFQGMYMTQDSGVRWLVNDEELLKRSYYSLRHIVIGGRCVCNGHAAKCRVNENDTEGFPKCECIHNTCGDHCDKCCPLYNQRPYRMGNTTHENRCEKCQCHGHATECRYSKDIEERGLSINTKGKVTGGGICVNCKHNTTGINCEKCLPGFYRPDGVLPNDPEACKPCNCSPEGVEGHCEGVGGQCHCKEGFTGEKCDRCLPGYRGSKCQKCGCNPHGTMDGGECESHCQCKLHVEGEYCDKCETGYFGLSANNHEGCIKCFCSGVTNICKSWSNQKLSKYETYENWHVTDITNTAREYPITDLSTGFLVFSMDELDIEAFYWAAPPSYLGNKLTSYGSHFLFKVDWIVVRGDTSGKPTNGPNIIIFGKNGLKIAYGDEAYGSTNATIDTHLTEEGWYHVPKTVKDIITRQRRTEYKGDPVTRVQFMSVLANIEAILLRATYHTDQAECILRKSMLYIGASSNESETITESLVEECQCPVGYTGTSCETCDFGFMKIYQNTTTHEQIGKCVACNCNGHAETCDLENGKCGTCQHNTEGEKCDKCKEGFYGNALEGYPDDCKPCACPLVDPSNNFSPTCRIKDFALDENHLEKNWPLMPHDYVCTSCPKGYHGDHCELCDDGFYGTPTELGSQCLPCPCNGGPCDAITGLCITCEGNTEGWRCEKCKPGFYGNASEGCLECECYDQGAVSNVCDRNTGHCECRERYSGAHCQECDLGYANLNEDCAPCECHEIGSESHVCDPDTGLCPCKSGVFGPKCDHCLEEFFNMTKDGCDGCNCHIHGSLDRVCDHTTGQCKCRPHVTGRRCDKCTKGFWNIDSLNGCVPCVCNAQGASDEGCDMYSGQCYCKEGVTGLSCDHCETGYWGFSRNGCKACDICDSPSKVCDPDTGRCICPPLSSGPDCQTCVANSYGWEFQKGCRYCQCDRVGAIGQLCHNITGQCECREGYAGAKCNTCAPGYYNYPECTRCNCDPRGSLDENGGDVIECDDLGQCPCKELVTGLRCNRCRHATFGLNAFNPSGCSRCFCFGRSQDCHESSLSWGQLRFHGSRNLSVEYMVSYDSPEQEQDHGYVVVIQLEGSKPNHGDAEIKHKNGLNLIPSSTGNVSIGSYKQFSEPFYFQLPKQFLGDQTKSYGGMLNFSIQSNGAKNFLSYEILRKYPLIQIHSHHDFILNYFGPEILETKENVTYGIRFHEHYWKYHFDGKAVSRAIFMTALENIKHIFLRATTSVDFTQVVISDISLDTAIPINGSTTNLATSVEVCKCDLQYDDLSCQAPANGFYRWRKQNSSELLEDLVGYVLPCSCNGRSESCDKETGHCTNCRENTGGMNCEVCAEGYYGSPQYGTCEACPCPETRKNFAKGCIVARNDVRCICKEGYTGRLCENCATGYYGNPKDENGSCVECNCDPDGIVSNECDEETGQCNCKPGITGRRCDKCELPRHYLESGKCRLCDECSQTLMDTIDELIFDFELKTEHLDLHGIPAPWIALNAINNETDYWTKRFNEFDTAKYEIEHFDEKPIEKLQSKTMNLHAKAEKIASKSEKAAHKTQKLQEVTELLLKDMQNVTEQSRAVIKQLNEYGTHDHHIQLPLALKEANMTLQEIKYQYASVTPINSSAFACADKYYNMWMNISAEVQARHDKITEFKKKMHNLAERIDDMKRIALQIQDMDAQIKTDNENIEKLSKSLNDKYNEIEDMKSDIKEIFSDTLNADSDVFLQLFKENLQKVDQDVQLITALRAEIEDILDENDDLLRDAKTFDLPRAKDHAEVLHRRANDYEALFADTRARASDAMSAIQAYDNITQSIGAAKIAAKEAHMAAEVANREIYPENGMSIIERSLKALHDSTNIKNEIIQETERLSELRDKLEVHQKLVADVNSTIWHCAVKDAKITAAQNAYDTNRLSIKEIKNTIEVSSKISDEMREVHRHASDINSEVYKLKNKLKTLDPEWDVKFGGAEENLTTVQSNIRIANQTFENIDFKFREQNEKFMEWRKNFLAKTQELKDKIALARHAAEGIHISVKSSQQNCKRSYMPRTSGPTTSTHILMTFALRSNNNPSAPLLFIKGEDTQFLALEMVNKKVRFVWNLGGKVQEITHPMTLEANDFKLDEAWYQVEVNRTLNLGTLIVKRMNEYGKYANGKSVSGSSDRTRFTYANDSRIWLGHVPEEGKVDELKAPNVAMNVILHQLVIDEETIGLWNFASTEGTCKGEIIGPSEATTLDNARGFNGHGYVVLKSNPRYSTKVQFSLKMVFRTLDENALLFLAVDEKSNGTLSLTLYQGRIVFRVDYEEDTWLELNTTKRYNTGDWITVDIARHFQDEYEYGSLVVVGRPVSRLPVSDSEMRYEKSGSPNRPINFSKLPFFQGTNYYIGGVPPGYNLSTVKARGADNAFLGCMKDVQIAGEAREILETTNHYGVSPSCSQTITKGGFYGNGFIELPAHSLKKRANFAFVFRTLQPNALIILGAHPPKHETNEETRVDAKLLPGNFSVNLVNGKLRVKVNAGQGPIELTSNNMLNDGKFHVVSVSKTGRRFELQVNDELQMTQSFKAPPFLVNLPEESEGGLFVGGAPVLDEFSAITSLEPFEGAIKDLVFNNRSISFDKFISFSNVHLGRDGPKMANDDEVMQMEAPKSGCNRVGSYSYEPNGFKFGDAPFSYSETKIPTRNLWQRNFLIQADFRTFYPNGILFVAPGTKEKQKHYIMLTLRDGMLTLIIRGRKKQSLHLPVKVNDGQWHRVQLATFNRTATLSVTLQHKNTHAQQMKIPKKLNASNKLFVGGLPDEAMHLPSELVSKLEGFKGCLRKFSVNNVTQDLAKVNSHKNVGQCFPRVEKGSYFPGDAYGIYKRNFNVGRVLELQLEYKTSELNGILLSVSDRDGFPALSLEMNNGNIVFSTDMGDGIPLRATKSMDSKYALCNNKWHTVYALYDSEQIFVRVDNLTSVYDVTPNRGNKIQTKSPLYIGGIPEQASQGTLLSRENFKGCINNVVIRGDLKDWTDYDHLHNILLNECPATT